jgi:hypothetical protein
MNRLKLKQLRDSIKFKINESPTDITYDRMPMIDNGYGGLMPDPYGTATQYSDRIRISHERISVSNNEPSPVGLSTSFGLFALMQYTSDMIEGEEFTDGVTRYKLGPVDQFERFGGVYALQSPLTIVSQSEAAT